MNLKFSLEKLLIYFACYFHPPFSQWFWDGTRWGIAGYKKLIFTPEKILFWKSLERIAMGFPFSQRIFYENVDQMIDLFLPVFYFFMEFFPLHFFEFFSRRWDGNVVWHCIFCSATFCESDCCVENLNWESENCWENLSINNFFFKLWKIVIFIWNNFWINFLNLFPRFMRMAFNRF